MRSLFKIFLLFFVVAPAFAQNKVGNGGDVVDCKTSINLLDFYEEQIDFKTKEKNYLVIADQQLQKLKVAAPKLGEQYLKRLKEIESEIDFKSDIKLTDIKDSLHLYQPLAKNCHVYQIAIRRPLVLGNEKRFIIRQDLWNRLSPAHKAGLLTHEIIYEHFSKLGESDSIKTRKVNTYLFSKDVKNDEFWKLVKNLELPIYPQ